MSTTAASLGEDKYSADNILAAAEEFVRFVNNGPSPYHVVQECKERLLRVGFKELSERDTWKIDKGGRYFAINNYSTIIAFAVGGKYEPGNGFSIVGAHTDSPCLRVKPRSLRTKQGYIEVGVEPYGGGIWHTWFDRDLKLAGRVVIKGEKGLCHRLVHIDEPLLKIPNICIHLARDMNTSFSFNKETQMVPILATQTFVKTPRSKDLRHHSVLLDRVAKELGCDPAAIIEFELCLADVQPAAIGGLCKEFIFAPRIDNLMNCYTGLEGLIGGLDSLPEERNVRLVALFDNEEVGSQSAQGAMSSMVEFTLRRICAGAGGTGVAFEESIPKSLLVSADQAHAIHPNYPEKHEENLRPMLHEGVVLKFNANQRYATTAITAAILRDVAARAKVPLQEVAVRNDSSCGSTIGPILSAKLGMRTVDIGTPQLSMHSIRETCCTSGVRQAIELYKEFFASFPGIDEALNKSE